MNKSFSVIWLFEILRSYLALPSLVAYTTHHGHFSLDPRAPLILKNVNLKIISFYHIYRYIYIYIYLNTIVASPFLIFGAMYMYIYYNIVSNITKSSR